MIYKTPLRSEIPFARVTKDIRWLEIHRAEEGFYLLQFVNRDLPPKWDSLYQSFQEVVEDCQTIWGVHEDMWLTI